MKLEILDGEFSICKSPDFTQVNNLAEFLFLAKTDTECSIVCPTGQEPANATDKGPGWRALRIAGQLDFSLIGILAKISGILAANQIGIFVVSTYDTDYVLVKTESMEQAVAVLRESGYSF